METEQYSYLSDDVVDRLNELYPHLSLFKAITQYVLDGDAHGDAQNINGHAQNASGDAPNTSGDAQNASGDAPNTQVDGQNVDMAIQNMKMDIQNAIDRLETLEMWKMDVE